MYIGAPIFFLLLGSLDVGEETSRTGGSSMRATFHCAPDAGSRRIRVRDALERDGFSDRLRGEGIGFRFSWLCWLESNDRRGLSLNSGASIADLRA